MPTITGRLCPLGYSLPRQHPEHLPVAALDDYTGQVVANSKLTDSDEFTLSVPSSEPMVLRIVVALPGVVPVLLDFDGVHDCDVALYFDNVQTSRY